MRRLAIIVLVLLQPALAWAEARPTRACYLGTWMEEPLDGAFRFRSAIPTFGTASAPQGAPTSLAYSYDHAGPILTLAGDGTFGIEDPLTVTMIDPVTQTPARRGADLIWQAAETQKRLYGTWRDEGGRVRLVTEAEKVEASITVLGHASPIDTHRRRRPEPDAIWAPVCEGDALILYAPVAAGGWDEVVARFRRIAWP